MKRNPITHHRRSIRLKNYDYAQIGVYFITICCEGGKCRFGTIENGEMFLNDAGKIAFDEWEKTPNKRSNIQIDAFVIMPNHTHAIITIRRGVLHTPLRSPSQTVGSIVRGYKSAVTKQLKQLGFERSIWQRNYYERIIHNCTAYQHVVDYIQNNPVHWKNDDFFTKN